ncbi:MAG TPA: ATP-binding protein, partial [Bacteroidia bacterium]|nr:ATP-binding protein [Bacteroidia bacterium]
AKKEIAFQNEEKSKRADELLIANKELAFQNQEKKKRAGELVIANKELAFQKKEKKKRANELIIANKELAFQNEEKVKRVNELRVANYARSLIEASRDPMFTVSPDGKITDINEATMKVTCLTRDELIGTEFFNCFIDVVQARNCYQAAFANGFVVDYPLIIHDGVPMDVLCNGSVYKDDLGNVIGVVIVARDVTEQKRIETELMEAKVFAELATEIAQEAKLKAENATRIAEDAVKAKQQFLSNMSHEIRTPMNAIIGFTKVVLKTELTAKQKEYLNAIKVSGDALIVLINDILDLAKVDAGKMSFERIPFRMSSSLAAMLQLFEAKIQEKNLQLVREYDKRIPEMLIGDPVRLHQIILNLVSNAVKFTNTGSITIKVSLLHEDNENVAISFAVIDTGIGIKESKIEKIFENFQQASSGTSRLYGGTGLGLAIVKQLVEMQGGKIKVISTIDKGSTFEFTLSFQKTNMKAETEGAFTIADSSVRDIKVLVVEDIPLNQLLMKTLLDDFGFDRDIAANGKIAIEFLQRKSYDLILMDLQMPEMNGFETTTYIRTKLNSRIPIIALTADVTTADLEKCRSVGMNDYIAKPVDEKLLYTKIIGLVKKPLHAEHKEDAEERKELSPVARSIDLSYLERLTKSDATAMMEMIRLYLQQTPGLIEKMKQSLKDGDLKGLNASVHKMMPSFAIVGISSDFETIAKRVLEYSKSGKSAFGIPSLIFQLENICAKACEELESELISLKKSQV